MTDYRENRGYTDKHQERSVHDHVASTEGVRPRKVSAYWSGIKRLFAMLDNNLWLLSGMAVGIATLMIAWWIISAQWPSEAHLHNPEPRVSVKTDSAGNQAIEKLEAKLNGLNDRVEMLTDSITYLESKLIRAHVITDSIINAEQKLNSSLSGQQPVIAKKAAQAVERLPPSAAGQTARDAGFAEMPRRASSEFTAAPRGMTVRASADSTAEDSPSRQAGRALPRLPAAPGPDTVTSKQSNTGKPVRGATSTVAVTQPQAPVSKKRPTMNPGGGHWVINLVSSPSKTDADRFAAKARSTGIETQQQQVTVKGKHFWRVQTTGFSTADEAKAYAGTVREKLGLKDVWITTR